MGGRCREHRSMHLVRGVCMSAGGRLWAAYQWLCH